MQFSTTVEREDEETGELVSDRAHQKLFQLKSPSSKSKIDWKYTQHNIEATEGTIFRNATIYFMVPKLSPAIQGITKPNSQKQYRNYESRIPTNSTGITNFGVLIGI